MVRSATQTADSQNALIRLDRVEVHFGRQDVLRDSSTKTTCPWNGLASYYSLELDGATSPDAAWYYPQPKDAAAQIRDRVAFWKDVQVTA